MAGTFGMTFGATLAAVGKPSLMDAFTRAADGSKLNGPRGENLVLRECGMGGGSCLFFVFSALLSGRPGLAPLLRHLGAVAALATVDDVIGASEGSGQHDAATKQVYLDMLSRELEDCHFYGRGLGQPILLSLADALGMRVAYTMKLGDKRMPWDVTPAWSSASQMRRLQPEQKTHIVHTAPGSSTPCASASRASRRRPPSGPQSAQRRARCTTAW
jgi:hypothetical protein